MLFLSKIILVIVFNLVVLSVSILNTNNGLRSEAQTREVITEILNNRCESAQKILLNITNYNDKIPAITKEVYSRSNKNENLILQCVKNLTKIEASYRMLKALQIEMKTHDRSNPFKLIQLSEIVDSEILKQTNGNDTKGRAKILLDDIMSDVEMNTLKMFKTAMLSHNFRDNPEVQKLGNAIHDFRVKLSDSIIKRLVNETFGQISSVEMADSLYYGSDKIPQIVMGLLALFQKLESTKNMNSEGVLRVAKYINMLRNMNNYYRLPKKKRIAVNKLIDKLPVCARNLFFALELCIWNRGKSEYLYTSDKQYYFSRRCVFSCPLEDILNDGIWNMEEIDDKFYFLSVDHYKEYLYASTSDRFGEMGPRLVETWMDIGFLGETSGWNIELDGDFCYLRNENFNEYMFLTDEEQGPLRRYVFTAKNKPRNLVEQKNFQWQIRNCG